MNELNTNGVIELSAAEMADVNGGDNAPFQDIIDWIVSHCGNPMKIEVNP